MPLILLDTVGIVFVAAALAILSVFLLRAIANVLRSAPLIPNSLGDAVENLGHTIASFFGSAFSDVTHAIGASFHRMSAFIDDTWHLINQIGNVLDHLANVIAGGIYTVSGLRALVRAIGYVAHTALRLVNRLEREFKGIEAGVKSLERSIAKGIGHDLRIQIKALEREWHGFKTKELPAIEADVQAIPGEIAGAERWVAKNFVSDAELAGEATAAAILAAAGVSWLRCNSNPFNNNRNACGLWGDLANLLAIAAIDAAALASLYELIGVAQSVTPAVTSAASSLLEV